MGDIGDVANISDELRKKKIQIMIDEKKVAIQRAEASIMEFKINSDKMSVEIEIYNNEIEELEKELNIDKKEV